MNNIDLTPIFKALVLLIAAIITYRVIPWIKAKTTNEQQAGMRALVKTLVFAAEQLYGAGNGPQKLEYVKQKLADAGFNVDVSEIEAAVKEAFNYPLLTLPQDVVVGELPAPATVETVDSDPVAETPEDNDEEPDENDSTEEPVSHAQEPPDELEPPVVD